MQSKSLTVELREQRGKGAARKARAASRIPGVLYGAGETSRPVQIDRKTFELLVRAGGRTGILDLTSTSGHEPVKALLREVQVHPVSREYVHVDLQRVSMTEKIRLHVPIVLVGKPEGVKTQGGILEHGLRSVEVECLPTAIPEQIEIDVSALTLGHSLHVSDLKVPGVVILAHAETAIATVSIPAAERTAEEVAAAATPEAAAAAGAPGAAAPAPAAGDAKAAPGAKPGAAPAAPAAAGGKPAAGAKPAAEAKPGKEPKGK